MPNFVFSVLTSSSCLLISLTVRPFALLKISFFLMLSVLSEFVNSAVIKKKKEVAPESFVAAFVDGEIPPQLTRFSINLSSLHLAAIKIIQVKVFKKLSCVCKYGITLNHYITNSSRSGLYCY